MFKFARGLDNQDVDAEKAGEAPVRHLSGAEFDEVLEKSQLPVVVDFWAEWCVPCHMLAPSVERLAREYDGKATVAKVNADDDPEILGRYGIRGIPTLIYFKDGGEVDRVVGVTQFGALKAKLDRLISTN